MSGTSLFGKIRAQGDFVRVRTGEDAAQAFVHWAEEANELLHRAGARLTPPPIAFLFRPAGAGVALVGALGPSEDKVGRPFPLALFHAVDARSLAAGYPMLPAAARSFFEGARALLDEAPALEAADLLARVDRLPEPVVIDGGAGEALAREGEAEPAASVLERLGVVPEGQRYYALHTFQVACQRLEGREPNGAGIALECPCSTEPEVWAWLELSRRALSWPVPPSFFWRTGKGSSLALSLGEPPPALLGLFSSARAESQRVWPLWTGKPAAIAVARKALSPPLLATLDRPRSTVRELIGSFPPS